MRAYLLDKSCIMITDVNHLILRCSIINCTLVAIRVVQLRAVNPLAIEKAYKFACISASLYLRLNAFDCDRFEFAEGRLEPTLFDTGCHDGWSEHLRFFFAFTLAFLCFEAVARVPSLGSSNLILLLAALCKHVKLLFYTLDLIQSLVRLGKIGAIWVDLRHKIALLSCSLKLSIGLLNVPLRILARFDS